MGPRTFPRISLLFGGVAISRFRLSAAGRMVVFGGAALVSSSISFDAFVVMAFVSSIGVFRVIDELCW